MSNLWFGMVWFGLVWFGMVWYGLVWFGMELDYPYKEPGHPSPDGLYGHHDLQHWYSQYRYTSHLKHLDVTLHYWS